MIMDVHEDGPRVLRTFRTLLAFLSWPLFRLDLRFFTHPTNFAEVTLVPMDVYETRSVKPGDMTATDVVIV